MGRSFSEKRGFGPRRYLSDLEPQSQSPKIRIWDTDNTTLYDQQGRALGNCQCSISCFVHSTFFLFLSIRRFLAYTKRIGICFCLMFRWCVR